MDKTVGKLLQKTMGDGEKKAPVKSIKIKIKFQKKKRSASKPLTPADKKLSIAHLKDTVAFNKRHIKDHQNLKKHGGSQKYNDKHIKGHKKDLKKAYKDLEDRKKMKRPSVAKAKMMLKDNSAQGHALTQKQKGFFGMIAGGKTPSAYDRAMKRLERGMRGYRR